MRVYLHTDMGRQSLTKVPRAIRHVRPPPDESILLRSARRQYERAEMICGYAATNNGNHCIIKDHCIVCGVTTLPAKAEKDDI